ncbi:MAG: hypothetical protein ACUVQP_01885 [Bacteroidales bacterium]
MKINLFFIYFILLTELAYAQLLTYPFVGLENKAIERLFYSDSNQHTSVKPYLVSFEEWQSLDSIRTIMQGEKIKTFVKPVINIDFNQNFKQFYQLGAEGFMILGKNLSAQFSLNKIIINPDSNLKKSYDSIGILEHYGKIKTYNSIWLRTHIEGAIHWQALPYLSFKSGIGKLFLGDGYRSLFLSDNTAPYPFFLGTAKIWKVKYLILYSFLNEPQWKNFNQPYERKNATLHYLSWNINKRLNINAFETVIWQVHDSIGNRGFDVNYINPIIFFRPIEFSIGSPDNVIMGFGFKYRIFKNTHFYTQLLLDEFKLAELKAKKGWWGNKFGIQAGIKTYRLFKNDHWFALLECNTVRPFTYSHSDYLSNWGNMHQPMAHPLGANFFESILQTSYNLKKWTFALQAIYQRQGQSNAQFNAGNNIYLSYNVNRQDYGNFLLVGSHYKLQKTDVRIYYLLKKSWHLHAYVQLGIMNQTVNNVLQPQQVFIHIGLLQSNISSFLAKSP